MRRGIDQLRLLPALAEERGVSFEYPKTKAEASQRIRLLLALPRNSRGEGCLRAQAFREDLSELGDARRVRAHELGGYGPDATWR